MKGYAQRRKIGRIHYLRYQRGMMREIRREGRVLSKARLRYVGEIDWEYCQMPSACRLPNIPRKLLYFGAYPPHDIIDSRDRRI